jgi:hypothetical protein
VRTKIVHLGESVGPWVFTFPDGFGIDVKRGFAAQLAQFGLWPDAVLKPNGIGCLLAIFEFIARDIREALDGAAVALTSDMSRLPMPITTNQTVYFRSPLNVHARNAELYRTKQWIEPATVLNLRKP